jgi:hypothetical protein
LKAQYSISEGDQDLEDGESRRSGC